jgi:hypothetical protein
MGNILHQVLLVSMVVDVREVVVKEGIRVLYALDDVFINIVS